jgi:GNAT superfamily N-acetyltransferase
MRRLLLSVSASLALYAGLFGLVLDRPLSDGFLQAQIDAKLARGAAVHSPKLVILAGSNGPYSHRCEVIEPILGMPCVNGGVAVGIGLDYLFARWEPLLNPGDTVYLPMEEAQYVRTHAATMLGPDAAVMLRHDWATLADLPPERWLGALFSHDLRGAIMSLVETVLVAKGFRDPRTEVTGTTNAWGDHVGHTVLLGAASSGVVATAMPVHVTADAIRRGDGSALIIAFITWARAHDVTVIGGLSTGFADTPLPLETLTAIRELYRGNDAHFLEMRNLSRYPRSAFFDTPEHLNEPAQREHSALLAAALVGARCHARALP